MLSRGAHYQSSTQFEFDRLHSGGGLSHNTVPACATSGECYKEDNGESHT